MQPITAPLSYTSGHVIMDWEGLGGVLIRDGRSFLFRRSFLVLSSLLPGLELLSTRYSSPSILSHLSGIMPSHLQEGAAKLSTHVEGRLYRQGSAVKVDWTLESIYHVSSAVGENRRT